MIELKSKSAILLVAFGSSSLAGEHEIRFFEKKVQERFPHVPIRWAFSSARVRSRLAKAKVKSDSISKALRKLYYENFLYVAVQSLHIIPGGEYQQMKEECQQAAEESHLNIVCGEPLLSHRTSISHIAHVLVEDTKNQNIEEDTAIIFIGHGTNHEGGIFYTELEKQLKKIHKHIFLATLQKENGAREFAQQLISYNIKKARLIPLLSVVGKHASSDIAGNKESSWESVFQKHSIQCEVILKGTVSYPKIGSVWIDHLQEALDML